MHVPAYLTEICHMPGCPWLASRLGPCAVWNEVCGPKHVHCRSFDTDGQLHGTLEDWRSCDAPTSWGFSTWTPPQTRTSAVVDISMFPTQQASCLIVCVPGLSSGTVCQDSKLQARCHLATGSDHGSPSMPPEAARLRSCKHAVQA